MPDDIRSVVEQSTGWAHRWAGFRRGLTPTQTRAFDDLLEDGLRDQHTDYERVIKRMEAAEAKLLHIGAIVKRAHQSDERARKLLGEIRAVVTDYIKEA